MAKLPRLRVRHYDQATRESFDSLLASTKRCGNGTIGSPSRRGRLRTCLAVLIAFALSVFGMVCIALTATGSSTGGKNITTRALTVPETLVENL